jgi:hypothetical protein
MSQRNSGYERQPDDAYETPHWVTRAVIQYLPRKDCAYAWDPADGPGSQIAEALGAAGYEVAATRDDFLATIKPPHNRINVIVCNPPWGIGGRLACRFIEHALELVPLVAMLLRIDFDSAKTRVHLFRDHQDFAGKITLLNRITWFEPEGAPGPSENHAWFLWDRRHRGSPPTIRYAGRNDELKSRRAKVAPASTMFLRGYLDAQSRILATSNGEIAPGDPGKSNGDTGGPES